MSLNCLESKDMINSFKVTYHDTSRNAKLCSFGAKQADVINHALRAKNAVSFLFEKHDGKEWVLDSEASSSYNSRSVKNNGKGPETELDRKSTRLNSSH